MLLYTIKIVLIDLKQIQVIMNLCKRVMDVLICRWNSLFLRWFITVQVLTHWILDEMVCVWFAINRSLLTICCKNTLWIEDKTYFSKILSTFLSIFQNHKIILRQTLESQKTTLNALSLIYSLMQRLNNFWKMCSAQCVIAKSSKNTNDVCSIKNGQFEMLKLFLKNLSKKYL